MKPQLVMGLLKALRELVQDNPKAADHVLRLVIDVIYEALDEERQREKAREDRYVADFAGRLAEVEHKLARLEEGP